MNIMEVIKTRKSVRTFDGRPLTEEDKQALIDYAAAITNPYGIPVTFVFLDAAEHGLSSPVINGEQLYVAGKIAPVPHCEEAFGYSFEKLVLFAWSRGIGTTWIGGTMKRELFEAAAATGENELMPIVSPLGYPSTESAEVDKRLRATVHADERRDPSELFFENDFNTPLSDAADRELLEAVRWSPTAVNLQPYRVVKMGKAFHFYKKHPAEYQRKVVWDVQKIDMGIALCHFLTVTDGKLTLADPGIPTAENTEYIATVTVE